MTNPFSEELERRRKNANPFQQELERRKKRAQSADNYPAQIVSGANQGLANVLGAPVDLANAAIGLGIKGVNAVTGTDFQPISKPFLGSAQISDLFKSASFIAPPSKDPAKQFTRRVAEEVGAAVLPAGAVARKAVKPVETFKSAIGASVLPGVGAATANQIAPDSVSAEVAGQLVGGLSSLGGIALANKISSGRAAREAVPTLDNLKAQTERKFKEAEAQNVQASPILMDNFRKSFDQKLSEEGILIDDDMAVSFPKLNNARKQVGLVAKTGADVPRIRSTRRALRKAASSPDNDERRVGALLLKEFDSVTDPVSPLLRQGRGLYHRLKKAETLQKSITKAERRAKRTGSPDRQLADRFRGLSEKIEDGKMRGFSPEEIAAINRVDQGGFWLNRARFLGDKLSPTGVSGVPTSGIAGLVGGYTAQSPLIGLGVGATSLLGGVTGRTIANSGTRKNAHLAELVVRNGGRKPASGRLNLTGNPKLLEALILAQAAQASNRLSANQGQSNWQP